MTIRIIGEMERKGQKRTWNDRNGNFGRRLFVVNFMVSKYQCALEQD